MNVLEVIKNRRSNGQVLEEPVAREAIEQLIEAGCWAPNHKRTNPFRFVVFEGDGLKRLQQAMHDGTATLNTNLSEAEVLMKQSKIEGKAFRAPCVIAVWTAVGRCDKNPPEWEDHAAVDACIQNMLLSAHELGLAGYWRSGSVVDMPEVHALMRCEKDSFSKEKGDEVRGFIYLGHPDPEKPEPLRNPVKWQNLVSFEN